MNEIFVNEQNRKVRSASARQRSSSAQRAASSSARGAASSTPAAAAAVGGAAAVGADGLAVCYDESVPASALPRKAENVRDMVAPDGLEMTSGAAPQAHSHAPPVPQPRPELVHPSAVAAAAAAPPPPVRNAAAAATSNAGSAAGMSTAALAREDRVPRHLNTNTHVNIFGFLGAKDEENAPVCRKRRLAFNPSMGTA
jgi:hypothetical protein